MLGPMRRHFTPTRPSSFEGQGRVTGELFMARSAMRCCAWSRSYYLVEDCRHG
jgi:hypothetical protein